MKHVEYAVSAELVHIRYQKKCTRIFLNGTQQVNLMVVKKIVRYLLFTHFPFSPTQTRCKLMRLFTLTLSKTTLGR